MHECLWQLETVRERDGQAWTHEAEWNRVMREKVWVRTCYPNNYTVSMATGAGTHAQHKGILGKHRFYIAPGFTLLCHHPSNTNAALPSNIYSLATYTVMHKWTVACSHTQSRQYAKGTNLTSLFLSVSYTASFLLSKVGPPAAADLKQQGTRVDPSSTAEVTVSWKVKYRFTEFWYLYVGMFSHANLAAWTEKSIDQNSIDQFVIKRQN